MSDSITQHISVPYLLSLVFLSYGLRDIVGDFIGVFTINKKVRTWSVFIIATLLAFVFGVFFKEDPVKLFVTYCVGTSLYELIIKVIIAKLKAS